MGEPRRDFVDAHYNEEQALYAETMLIAEIHIYDERDRVTEDFTSCMI